MSRNYKKRKTRRIRRVFLTIRTILLILLVTVALLLVGGRLMDAYLGTHVMEDFLRAIPVQEWLKLPDEVLETSQTPAVSDSLTPRPTPAVTAAPVATVTPGTPEGEAAEFAAGYDLRKTKATQTIKDELFPDKYAFGSKYAIVVDLDHNEVLAQKDAEVRMNPASMTKIPRWMPISRCTPTSMTSPPWDGWKGMPPPSGISSTAASCPPAPMRRWDWRNIPPDPRRTS